MRHLRGRVPAVRKKEGKFMARYVKDLVLNKPDDFVQFIMNDFMQKNQFKPGQWKGEPAYFTGNAALEGVRFMKWSYADGKFHLEAWLQGTMGGEWDLDGFVGIAMKKPYKNSLEQLFQVLQQDIPAQNVQSQGAQSGAAGDNAAQSGPAPQTVTVKTVDNTGAATASLVLGILSIIVGMFWALIGVILGIIGIMQAKMGAGSSKAGLAKGGKVTSIIGICISAAGWLLNIILAMAVI